MQTPLLSAATLAPNRFVDSKGRRLAYRSIGTGQPIVLCTRFRGNMDVWDPAFLDELATRHEHPEASAAHISTFVRTTRRRGR